MDAISLSIDYAYGRFEEDDELFLDLLQLCSVMRHFQIGHQNYKNWHDELLYHRDIVHQQCRDIRKWQQYKSFDKLRERQANKFAEKLVDKIHLPSPQEKDKLVQRLASQLDLQFVEKGTLIYNEKIVEEKLYFVVIGSVGLYNRQQTPTFPLHSRGMAA
jgi:hypothetical protein